MEDQTTTDVSVNDGGVPQINGIAIDDQGRAIPEPEETESAPAVTETTEVTEEQANVAPASASDEDAELVSWAEKKGLQLDSDNATKAAKMAREAERAMHQKAQRASELERSLSETSDEIAENIAVQTGQDPEVLKRLQRMEVKESVRDFWSENPDARQYEQSMIAELQSKPHLAGDLESLYANAVVKSGGLGAVKSQGKKEALESLAHKQQAAMPTGSAVTSGLNSNSITPQNVDQLVGQNSYEWYTQNRDAINRAMAG